MIYIIYNINNGNAIHIQNLNYGCKHKAPKTDEKENFSA